MFNKISVAVLAVVLLLGGFSLGVMGQSNNLLGGTSYDRSNLVGDVYQGQSNALVMSNGLIVGPSKDPSKTVSSSGSLTVAESDTTVYITTTGSTTTLPAVSTARGVSYRFVIGTAFTGAAAIVSADAGAIEGSLLVAGATVNCTAATNLTFPGTGEDVGDFVEIRSNGTKWFIGESNASSTGQLTCS